MDTTRSPVVVTRRVGVKFRPCETSATSPTPGTWASVVRACTVIAFVGHAMLAALTPVAGRTVYCVVTTCLRLATVDAQLESGHTSKVSVSA